MGISVRAVGRGFGWAAAVLMTVGAASSAYAQPAKEPVRSIQHWDLPSRGEKLAIGGYDPVAYFPEGGGVARKGVAEHAITHGGVTYRFVSKANADLFRANPARYEPAHGGWCSWAMINGEKTEPDPKAFIVRDGRLFLFYKGFGGDTRASWLKGDHASQTTRADGAWKRVSGEDARTPAMLAARLDAKREEMNRTLPPAMKETFEKGIRDVAGSGVLAKAMTVGMKAPDFTLPDGEGRMVRLGEMLAKGPVVLTWYRGGWCPYCNIQLRAYQEVLPELKAAGATLVALSPEKPDATAKTAEASGLGFTVLSDAGNGVGKSYGVVYELPAELVDAFRGRLDLPAMHGTDAWELPLAATYVIDRDGMIAYAFVDADYRKRAEPWSVIDAVRGLGK